MNEQFSAFLDGEATRDEGDSVVSSLLRDAALRDSWSRQHWLRTTLREHSDEQAVSLDAGFSSRVMQAIAADRGVQPGRVSAARSTPSFVSPDAAGRRRRRWRSRVVSAAAVASVASVAFLVSSPFQRSGSSEESFADAGVSTTNQTASINASDTIAAGAGQASMVPTFDTGSSLASAFMSGSDESHALSSERSSLTRGLDIASVAPNQQFLSDATGSTQNVAQAQTVSSRSVDQWSVSDPALRDELNGYLVDHNGMARGYGLSGTTPALVRVATYGQETTQ